MGKSKDLATRVGIDDNADATAITITSQENVAIGGTTVTDVNLLNIQGSGASKNIGVVLNDTNTSKIYGIQNGGSSLKFFDYSASATRMTIDGSGNVTIPNQPSFSATGAFGWRDYNSYSEVPTWTVSQSKSHNVGSHFNVSNGRFTAPVAGRYQFNFVCYVNNTGEQYHNSRLYINGTKYADNVVSHQSSSSNTYDNTTAGVYVLNLASGDYVSLYHINDLYGYHTTFSGYLIG